MGLSAAAAGAQAQEIVFQRGGIVQPLPQPTVIKSDKDVARLKTAQGITLQWIGWEERGDVTIEANSAGVWRVSGSQSDGFGRSLMVNGTITEIGEDYFLLKGRIQMKEGNGETRNCDATKTWRFAVTQNRTYYRLREFEWCDDLTDYIDIYFAPRLR